MQRHLIPVTIANGAALSGDENLGPHALVGVIMPAAWTAADITIQALALEAGVPAVQTWAEVIDTAGNNVTLTGPAAGEYVAIASTALVGLGRVRIRSGTSGAPVNQGAQRDFFLVVVDA